MKYVFDSSKYLKIPHSILGYWLSDNFINLFENSSIGNFAISDGQTKTGDNDKYLRFLWEVESSKIGRTNKWNFHVKGGTFRRWYGNIDTVINWSPEARKHYREDKVARIAPEYIWFREGLSWNLITTNERFAVRLLPDDCLFNLAAPSIFFENLELNKYILGLLNTKVSEKIIRTFNPTLNTNIGDVLSQPLLVEKEELVIKIVESCVENSKQDWEQFETAWNFKKHPLI